MFYGTGGFYCYDDGKDEIVPFGFLNDALGNFKVCDKVIPVSWDRYWIISGGGAVLVRYESKHLEFLDYLDLNACNLSIVKGSETVLRLSDDEYLFGIEEGFLIHRAGGETQDGELQARLRIAGITVGTPENSMKENIGAAQIVMPNKSNLVVDLSFSGIKFPEKANVFYQLNGYDYSARRMNRDMTASYIQLGRGSYEFCAWLEDGLGNRLAGLSVPVTVNPGIFASTPAIIIYALLFALLCYCAYLTVKYLLKRQKRLLTMTLRNEQLEESLLLKSKELARYSLVEAQRNNVLKTLKETIDRMRFGAKASLSARDYENLSKIIREGEFSDDSWSRFYENFDLIHRSFFRILKNNYPDLTSNDLRLCAYLRLNMPTKELADVLNITVKSAEVAKYRLRKKLKVDSSIPLHTFLIGIGSNS